MLTHRAATAVSVEIESQHVHIIRPAVRRRQDSRSAEDAVNVLARVTSLGVVLFMGTVNIMLIQLHESASSSHLYIAGDLDLVTGSDDDEGEGRSGLALAGAVGKRGVNR